MPTQAGIRIQKNTMWNYQEGSWWLGVGYSPTGWMSAEIIYENIGNISSPHLGKHNVKFPVIIFCWWTLHPTNLPTEWTLIWTGLNIYLPVLKCHKTSPTTKTGLDNSSPRVAWQKLDKLFDKEWFSPFLDGFWACGFYPWNAETTVFSKYLGGKKLPRNASSTHTGKTVANKMFQETLGRHLTRAEEKEEN